MHYLFGSSIFHKYPTKGNCIRHKKILRVKEGDSSCMEKPQEMVCDTCGCNMEKDTTCEAEYVSASYIQGKYVLLYVTDPTGNSVPLLPQPITSTAPTLPQHSTGNVNLLSGLPITSVTTSSLSSSGRPSHSTYMIDSHRKKSQRIVTLLSTFCRLLIRQLTEVSLREGRTLCPITILEVRQPGDRANILLSCGDHEEQHIVTNPNHVTDVDIVNDIYSQVSAEVNEVISLGIEEFPPTSESTNEGFTVTHSSFFGGWLSLECLTAHRQIIQKFGVTSWPSILLFDPDGRLVTTSALEHIRREMNFYMNLTSQSMLPAGDDAIKQKHCHLRFHSDFPWVNKEVDSDSNTWTEQSADTFPASSLLRRLVLHARRVGDVLHDEAFIQTNAKVETDDETDWDTCLGGATHLLLYFGGGWHPSSRRFLPQLRHLWLSFKNSNVDNNDGTENNVGSYGVSRSQCIEGRLLNKTICGVTLSPASHGVLSYQLEMSADRQDPAGQSVCDLSEALSTCSLPRTSTHLLLGGRGVDNLNLMTKSSGEGLSKKTTLTSFEDDNILPQLQQSEQQPTRLQVIYLSCDVDKSQLFSVLSGMPPSWLCISSVFGLRQRKLIETCMEIFNVCVFPRLVISEVICEPNSLEVVNEKNLSVNPFLNTKFHIVQLHGEEAVLCGDGVKKFLKREEKTDNLPRLPFKSSVFSECLPWDSCCSTIKSVFSEGGCLFVLCGIGKVSAELHKVCISVLQEASRWWSQEVEILEKRLENRWSSLVDNSSVSTALCACRQEPEKSQLTTLDDTTDVMTEEISAEKFLMSMTDKHAVCLPVSFLDAIVEESKDTDMTEEGALNRSSSNDSLDDNTTKGERYLLQEFVLSEVLRSEQLLPPVKGEPFLVCLQWPARCVAVLRRQFEFETSTISTSNTYTRFNCNISTMTPCSTNNIQTTSVAVVDGRQVVSSDVLTECTSCHSPTSSKPQMELSSSEIYLTNPLCSVSKVKAFIAQHCLSTMC